MWRTTLVWVTAVALFSPEVAGAAEELRLSTPFDAIHAAVTGVQPSFTKRWVWIRSGDVHDVQALWDALDKLSRSSLPVMRSRYRPRLLPNGILAEIDLRTLAPTDTDLQQVIDTWEDFQFDPSFARLTTKDTLDLLNEVQRDRFRSCRWTYWWKTIGGEWGPLGGRTPKFTAITKDTVVARENGVLPEVAGLSMLQEACETLAPVVEFDYFIARALSTIKDRTKVKVAGRDEERENVFSVVWGGRYNEFRGIRKSVKKGRTDRDQFLIDFGAVPLDDLLRSRSVGRVAIPKSAVTKKPRWVLYFGTSGVHPGLGAGFGSITLDIRDQDVDLGDTSYASIVFVRPQAYEAIIVAPNGQLVYALFGADGELLEEADAKVAQNHRVTDGSTRLLSAISCIDCHGAADGWQPMRGVAPSRSRNTVFLYDIRDRKRSPFDLQDFVEGAYGPNPEVAIDRANTDYGQAVLRSTGRWGDKKFRDIPQLVSIQQASSYARERFSTVGAEQALRRLGIAVKGNDGVATLGEVLPPAGLVEDPNVAVLLDGESVPLQRFQLSYQDLLTRAWRNRK